MKRAKLSLIMSLILLSTSTVTAFANNTVDKDTKVESAKSEDKIKVKKLQSKKSVSLTDSITIKLPKEAKDQQILGVSVENDNEFVPVSVVSLADNQVKIRPYVAFKGNTKYIARIVLEDGTCYSMDFTTIASPRRADKENNDSISNANKIIPGENIIGNINGESKTDWYKVYISKTGNLDLEVTHKEDNKIELALYGSNGDNANSICNEYYGNASVRTISTSLEPGTYYIKVKSGYDGEYQLNTKFTAYEKANVEDNAENSSYMKAKNIDLNKSIKGHIANYNENCFKDEIDWYKIEVKKTGKLNMEVTHKEDSKIEIALYGSKGENGNSICNEYYGNASIRTISTSLEPGTYYIRVKSGYSGEYELNTKFTAYEESNAKDVAENSSYMKAKNIELNRSIKGHIANYNENCFKDEIDWYKIEVKKTGKLNMEVIHKEDSKIELALYGSKGENANSICNEYYGNASIRTINTNLEPGTYYIRVKSGYASEYDLTTSFK